MFLVVGQRGSEARLVADALAAHPDLVVAGGGEILLPLAFLLQRVSDPDTARRLAADLVVADRGFAGGIGRHLSADDVRVALADAPLRLGPLLSVLYAAVATAAGVGDAGTLLTVLGNPVLNRTGLYEGDVALIHVVRDVRAVVAASAGNQSPGDIARQWDQANRLFRDRRGGDRSTYALVRYEDFVQDPCRAVAGLASLLRLEGKLLDQPALAVEAPPALAPEVASLVKGIARQGLFDFGYDPPPHSGRRLLALARRRLVGAGRRARHLAGSARDRLWVLRAPPPWAAAGEREALAPFACNVCRWTGDAFAGHQHAESADCPRCGSIARERFHLHGLGADPVAGRMSLLEIAPRRQGAYARAMRRWFDYSVLEPATGGTSLGHLAGMRELAGSGWDRVLSAHDLQSVPDPDAAIAEMHRLLRPGGVLLVQVPVLDATSTALEAAPTAAAGTARWSFGVDLRDRLAAAGFTVDLLVTDDFTESAAGGPDAWAGASGSGEVDLGGVLGAAATAPLTPVADRPTARRRAWTPAVLFITFRARKEA